MYDKSNNTKKYFLYSSLLNEIRDFIAQLAAIKSTNPSYLQVWKIYHNVVIFENNQKELNDLIFDTLPKFPSDLNSQFYNSGLDQNVINGRDAILLLEKVGNANESVLEKLRLIRQLLIRSSTETITSEDRLIIHKQITSHIDEIERIARSSYYNTISIADGTNSCLYIQVGLENDLDSCIEILLPNLLPICLNIHNTLGCNTNTGMPLTDHDFGPNDKSLHVGNQAFNAIPIIDCAIQCVINYESRNGDYINSIRSAQDATKDRIFTLSNSLESYLRKLADVLKEKAIFYYSHSSKKEIPHNIQ